MEVFTQLAEHPWRIVFELEVVLGRWGELVADTVERERDDKDQRLPTYQEEGFTHMSKVNLCFAL